MKRQIGWRSGAANLQLSWLVSEKVPLLEFVFLLAVDTNLKIKGTDMDFRIKGTDMDFRIKGTDMDFPIVQIHNRNCAIAPDLRLNSAIPTETLSAGFTVQYFDYGYRKEHHWEKKTILL